MTIVAAAIAVNAGLPARAFAKARGLMGDPRGKTVALLGLSFKPNTDDIRQAGSLELTRLLLEAGATVRAHDPVAMPGFQKVYPDLTYCKNGYEACEGADLAVLVTEWNQYRQLDLNHLGEIMRSKAFLDCRNVYSYERLTEHGFAYDCFGRPRPARVEVVA
jgi:UDPglucose 6-dehydrogenase